jgi:hypothetical protein
MWTFHSRNADTILFSQVGQFLRWDVCLPIGLLIGVVVLGIWTVARIRRWRTEFMDDLETPAEELTLEHFQQLFDEGLLDPHEFERIKARLQTAPTDMVPKNEKTDPSNDQPPNTSFHPD